ncbi:helix-turn-helix transcriptional regulator [Corallincola platygyrae]|uniref:Helix-turn-helix transcriptional regulator n=1 Tax=Corallincola platygyrae TaxID=1193278 RepID=A0ABW4XJE7_9GAMM
MPTKNERAEDINSQALLSSNFLLTEAEVRKLMSISRSTLRRWIKAGNFPAPVQLPGRRVAWRSSDLNTWLDNLNDVNWSHDD